MKTYDLLVYKPIFGRMTAAQQVAIDNIEDAPVHLTPYVFFLLFLFSFPYPLIDRLSFYFDELILII